ncbi:hypothetical protein [Ralstonia phage RSP15]|uniref:hypothetical protein n=1 Tax=Ralstonia phage RSP15 TaxID=1785960 RepID=UPI00074D426D|nr:hypothetical protein BH754_gp237 [Ralstonia phage RSP15]BAU40069.1 hypothetical protein [Ralstonia phage RSP15]
MYVSLSERPERIKPGQYVISMKHILVGRLMAREITPDGQKLLVEWDMSNETSWETPDSLGIWEP